MKDTLYAIYKFDFHQATKPFRYCRIQWGGRFQEC